MISAREVALETLIKVLGSNNSYSNISLNNSLEKAKLDERDSALATNIVYGTIQYKIFLEYQLKPLIKTKLVDYYLEPLLLMSAYQYFFLDKVPTNAIFDEANKLAKKFSKKNSGSYKLVNGILRSLDRQGQILPKPEDTLQYLSVLYSFPEWLVSYLVEQFGEEKTIKILNSSNQSAKNSIRLVNKNSQVKTQLDQLGYEYEESPLTSSCLFLNHGGIAKTDLFKEGKITIQDSAASLAVEAFDFNGNEQVLDACAAPGGKTVQIAKKLEKGNVIALDIHENKLRLVKKIAKRLHVGEKVATKALDARKAPEYFSVEQFDKILVDAPCTGLGLIRRKPEIRYEKSFKDIENLSQIQLDILDQVSSLVAKNGELVYSTCTISKQENEDVANKFLDKHPEFELKPVAVGNLSKRDMVRIFPDEYQSDGFFIAKFIKRGKNFD